MRFRKKPVEIEAIQWHKMGDHDQVEESFGGPPHCFTCGEAMKDHGVVPTLEGRHLVCPGDWIITGIKGEHYPCKPDIFVATYDPVAVA